MSHFTLLKLDKGLDKIAAAGGDALKKFGLLRCGYIRNILFNLNTVCKAIPGCYISMASHEYSGKLPLLFHIKGDKNFKTGLAEIRNF